MKIACELLAFFRQKAGTDRLELEVTAGSPRGAAGSGVPFGTAPCKAPAGREAEPTVLEALQAAEAALGGQALLQGERLREGVLVFLKEPGGATRRVFRPAEQRVGRGQALVLSTAMGGG